MNDNEKLIKIADLVEGDIGDLDRDELYDIVYEIKWILKEAH